MATHPFIVSDLAEGNAGGMIVNKVVQENFVLKLFKNNHIPDATDDESDFTEATFTGYLAKTLTGASWVLAAGDPTTHSYAAQTFASTAVQTAQTIYGYYYVGLSSGKLKGAQLLDSPVTIRNNTDSITITPVYTTQSAE